MTVIRFSPFPPRIASSVLTIHAVTCIVTIHGKRILHNQILISTHAVTCTVTANKDKLEELIYISTHAVTCTVTIKPIR